MTEHTHTHQWLGHGTFTAEGIGSIPGQGTKMTKLNLSGLQSMCWQGVPPGGSRGLAVRSGA